MKINSKIAFGLGILIILLGIYSLIIQQGVHAFSMIPILIGIFLSYLGWKGGRTATIIFGHACIVIGCYLITWGIYLLPHSEPIFVHIIGRPLFWGLISVFGGICANYHGFCNCVTRS